MISQKKIAEHLNLGRSTVANILRNNGAKKYNEETCKAVLEAAEKFGYKPNRASRSVRSGRSNLIGAIHFGSIYDLGKTIGHVLTSSFTRRGYDLLAIDLAWHGGDFTRAIDLLVESRVEGVIVSQMIAAFSAKEIAPLLRAGIKVVAIQGSTDLGVPVVHGDTFDAFRRMTHHLVGIGHRRIMLLVNDYNARPTLTRIGGFTKAIEECGGSILPLIRTPDEVVHWPKGDGDLFGKVVRIDADNRTAEHAFQYVRRLIGAGALPDAIVCSNDRWAKDVITALLQAGLRVPEDVAVVGCDNDSIGNYDPYYLTTIEQNISDQAEKAAELLLGKIDGGIAPEKEYLFPCPLVVRRSCGTNLASTRFSLPTNILN